MMRNAVLYAAGIAFLGLAKAKHSLRGYISPKPVGHSGTEQSIAYDLKVVEEWLSYLKTYTGGDGSIRDQNVLELGPGSDLGVGLYLLAKGAAGYNACDVNDLTSHVPESFYAALIERMASGKARRLRNFSRRKSRPPARASHRACVSSYERISTSCRPSDRTALISSSARRLLSTSTMCPQPSNS